MAIKIHLYDHESLFGPAFIFPGFKVFFDHGAIVVFQAVLHIP